MTNEQQAVVTRIAEVLGETESVPRRQISNIVALCGADFVGELLAETQRIEAEGGLLTGDGARRRSPGGVFFHLARQRMTAEQKRQVFGTKRKKKKAAPPAAQPVEISPERPTQSPALPTLRWRDREPLLPALLAQAGTVSQVTLTLRGRPGRVNLAHAGLVLLALKHEARLTKLPDGVPAPDGVTRYYLLVDAALWPPVAQALNADSHDTMLAVGSCSYDPAHEAVIVQVVSLTTHALQHGRTFDEAPPVVATGSEAFEWANRQAVFRVLWGDPGEVTSAVIELVGQPGPLNDAYRKLRIGALRQTGTAGGPDGTTLYVAYLGNILLRRVMDRVQGGGHDLVLAGYLLHDRKTDTLAVFVTGTDAVPRLTTSRQAAAAPADQLAALLAEDAAIKAELDALLDDPAADAGVMAQLIKRRRDVEKALKRLRKAHPGIG